jgi:hypothetical protein
MTKRRKFEDIPSKEAKNDHMETPEDGVPDSEPEGEEKKEASPQRRESKLKADEDLS